MTGFVIADKITGVPVKYHQTYPRKDVAEHVCVLLNGLNSHITYEVVEIDLVEEEK